MTELQKNARVLIFSLGKAKTKSASELELTMVNTHPFDKAQRQGDVIS